MLILKIENIFGNALGPHLLGDPGRHPITDGNSPLLGVIPGIVHRDDLLQTTLS